LHSELAFDFEPTSDYKFVLNLYSIALQFIQFLCYRENVSFSEIKILAPYKDGKHEEFAQLFVNDDIEKDEPDTLKNHKYIQQKYLGDATGDILNDISENRIYLRHLPESYKKGRIIDAARFVMITAAFEWTFNKNYGSNIEKSRETIEAENHVLKTIDGLISETHAKEKEIYKFLRKCISFTSLKDKIIQMGTDYNEIVGTFGNRLYSLNDSKLDYKDMGERLGQQRNNYAHGNLDKDFIGLSLVDLVYLEYVVYAMQLHEYGIDDRSIKIAINDLFSCGISVDEN
jgi:hypothetical protein